MKIREYLEAHPEINENEFWEKVRTQCNCNGESNLTNFMVYMDMPFWKVEHLYDISYERKTLVGDKGVIGTTYEFMVETDYDPEFSGWLESDEAEAWFRTRYES